MTSLPARVPDGHPPSSLHRARRAGPAVDQSAMRASNLGAILRQLRDDGPQSRAGLAARTGLSRAAMSGLISELVQRGLVQEGATHRDGAVGRPGQLVDLAGDSAAGLGVEINVDYLAVAAVDLSGRVIRETLVPADVRAAPVAEGLDLAAIALGRMIDSLRQAGYVIAGATLAPPGFIDYDEDLLRFAPNLGWRNVRLTAEVRDRLTDNHIRLSMENDAKLGAIAALAETATSEIQDLVYLTGQIGIGAGIISDGQLLRGWAGIAGEVGHLPLGDPTVECSCGRVGCWETAVGLAAFLDEATDAGDASRDATLSLEQRFVAIRGRLATGDARAAAALDTLVARLTPGLSLLVDVLNPRLIVLGGYFAELGDPLMTAVQDALASRGVDVGSIVQVRAAGGRAMAAAIGGAHFALAPVFLDPTLLTQPTPG